MIKSLKIKNFKSIKELYLELQDLNLFCGENASGKTSAIHALLAAVQKNDKRAGFDGELIRIGNFIDIRTRGVVGNIEIEIEDMNNTQKKIKLARTDQGEQTEILEIEQNPTQINIEFEKNLFYLSSNRIGVIDTYLKGSQKFGINGSLFVDFLSKYRNDIMPISYTEIFNNVFEPLANNTVEENVFFWFENITGEKIRIVPIPNTNQYVLTYGGEDIIRSINTGSGLSYLIPIITVCIGALLENERPVIIIENPEIYLHPGAQIKLSNFLLFIAKHAQLIVETHSDHILKTVMEANCETNKIFVFKLENGLTNKIELSHGNFKTRPISYSEVQYKTFGLPSQDLHTILYSQLHNNFISSLPTPHATRLGRTQQQENERIKKFDSQFLMPHIGLNSSLKKEYRRTFVYGNPIIYETLPTYIRNCIDHPSSTNAFTEQELKSSIDFMLSIL